MKQSLGAISAVFPTPVWIIGTYDEQGRPNMMAVAWGGVCCSKPPSVCISLRKATYSYGSITKRRAFTVNIASEKFVKEADYFGIASGRDRDKLSDTGLTAVKSDLVDAPYLKEFPMILECRVTHVTIIGLHTQFIGEIVDIKADREILNESGHADILRVKPIVYSPPSRKYYTIGAAIGEAYSLGRKFAE